MSVNVKESRGRSHIPIEICDFIWSIENFSLCSYKVGEHLTSPTFTTGQSFLTTWCLSLYPNGRKKDESEGKIGIYLTRTSYDSSAHFATFKLGFIGTNQASYFSMDFEHLYEKPRSGWGAYDFIDRKTLLGTQRSLLLSKDILMVKCQLKTSRVNDNVLSELLDELSAEEPPPVDSRAIIDDVKSLDYLSRDFRHLYESKMHADFTLMVGHEKLPVHKIILSARSSVFATMLKHDLKEKLTNCVEIKDLDSSVVKIMVRYLYCGQLEDLCPEMCIQLYSAAEKYDVQDLKHLCVNYLLRNLSVDNVCDVLLLGDLHDEPELIAAAKNFISMNAVGVQETAKWLNLSVTNPDLVFALNRIIISGRRT